MLLSGFVGLGFFAYRGTKKNAAAPAAAYSKHLIGFRRDRRSWRSFFVCRSCCGAFGRLWHKADNPVAPAFVRYWTRADKVGFRVLEVCPLLTIADMDTQFTDEVMNSQNPQRAPREAHNRELATSLQRRPAACLSRLQTTSTRGLRACILRVAGCATPTDSPATLASAGTLT